MNMGALDESMKKKVLTQQPTGRGALTLIPIDKD